MTLSTHMHDMAYGIPARGVAIALSDRLSLANCPSLMGTIQSFRGALK